MENQTPFEEIIALMTRSFAGLESRAVEESKLANLTMKQIVYLETIAKLESPTFSNLAKKLAVSKPSVTAIVGKLLKNGYVQKVQSDEDRRSFHILLTEKGRKLSQVHDALHRQIAGLFAAALDEGEMQQLACLLRKVVRAL